MNERFDHRLTNVLLYKSAFVHTERVVVHGPSTCLFGLVSEHSDTFGLGMIKERRKQGNNAQ